MTYTMAENEIIGLCIALEAIDDIANREMLELRNVPTFPGEVEVCFPSRVHQQLFLVRLLDFAMEKGDSSLTGVPASCLDVLQAACESKCFNVNDSVASLVESTKSLADWLKYETPLNLWLPSLKIKAKLQVPRFELLKISRKSSKA